ncbi:MAG: hypothetical protein ABWY06_04380 [Pseudomonas sp.]|uniref:cyanobactin maturation protease PatG family protein n=1 Tax=Pseudomonas sp. TaxID=306 RepID=UPI00339323BD
MLAERTERFAPVDSETTPGILPAGCGCANAGAQPYTAYVLGQLGYDFETENNWDSFVQRGVKNPQDPVQLLAHLDKEPWAAAALAWTVLQEGVPLYAMYAGGPYARDLDLRFRQLLQLQLEGKVEMLSFPGDAGGSATLRQGQEVPILTPNLRGVCAWTTADLSQSLATQGSEAAAYLENFLQRIYYEFQNRGATARERALNHAATNAFQAASVCQDALGRGMTLDTVDAKPSRIGRVDSDCWDVEMTFFDPANRLTRARHIYRFTIDVSQSIPVTIGTLQHWDAF